MGQFFGYEEITTLTIQSVTTVRLPVGSHFRIGGQGYSPLTNLDCNTGTSGAGGLDTGSVTANTFYYLYAVVASGSPAIVASLSSSAPTGFTAYRKIGGFFVNGSSNVTAVTNSTDSNVLEQEIPVVWDDISFTPPHYNFSLSVAEGHLYRVGKMAFARGHFVITSAGAGFMEMDLPNINGTQLTVDNTAIANIGSNHILGRVAVMDLSDSSRVRTTHPIANFAGQEHVMGVVLIGSSTRLRFQAGNEPLRNGAPITFTSGDILHFDYSLPITEWNATDKIKNLLS